MQNKLRAIHALVSTHQYEKAFKPVSNLLDEYPDNPEVLFLAGSTMRGLDCCGMALPLLAKALAQERHQPNLWMQYGACLHDLSRWDEAMEVFGRVHSMLPDDAMPLANISAGLVQQGKWRDAIERANDALVRDADNYIAHISKGFACLGLGRWRDAWEHAEYLYGQHLVVRVYRDPENEEPTWDGTLGQTVVVTCDQGVGDIIMLLQCLPQMQRDCKQVIVECAPRMVRLIERNFPGVIVYGTLKSATLDWPKNHEIDAHIHLSYLGRFYRNTDKDFPRKAYIRPDEARLAKWRAWLEQFPRPWIGIAWQGGIQKTQKHLRSVTLQDYAPILERGGTFVDLSYHDSAAEVAAWNIDHASQVVRPPVDERDYDDTVALIAALSEVVTVTTTVAHVCGALGRSACVLVPEVPTWRYAYHCGDGMVWYPEDSVRLFRRKRGEDGWSAAIKRIERHMEGTRLQLCA